VKFEVLSWKKDFKGKTFLHLVFAEPDIALGEDKSIDACMLNYVVKCLDTGEQTTSQERRNLVKDVLDLKPSWSTLNELRERLL